jgi:hypothetical protein
VKKNQKYICCGCYSLFEVHETNRKEKPFCTGCGDYVDVRVYREPPKKKKNYQSWTEEDIEQLKEFMNKGLQTRTIAYMLNRSIDAVRLKIYRIKGEENVSG